MKLRSDPIIHIKILIGNSQSIYGDEFLNSEIRHFTNPLNTEKSKSARMADQELAWLIRFEPITALVLHYLI
jgi:hypothetical protein